ncbi:hemolysin XhlA family protein [Cytobacillus sp.]|uniref:hemolysin XhlA family protein n=1 Tax=Cytobacillus sp. TaxID=2675269 RepID=UPI0037C09598
MEVIFYERRLIKMDQRVSKLEIDMTDVKTRLAVAEASLKDVKEDIRSIKDDTKWLRRAITNALIVGIIGGAVAIFYTAF